MLNLSFYIYYLKLEGVKWPKYGLYFCFRMYGLRGIGAFRGLDKNFPPVPLRFASAVSVTGETDVVGTDQKAPGLKPFHDPSPRRGPKGRSFTVLLASQHDWTDRSVRPTRADASPKERVRNDKHQERSGLG